MAGVARIGVPDEQPGAYDLIVVGGGINGAGIARDAAGRGLRVALVEQADLASATSSASTKLIHGGLRYLEYYEFRLVREALREREVLLRLAPHIIKPMRFVLPHDSSLRPAWMIRLGLALYDTLGWEPGHRRLLPRSRGIDLRHDPRGEALRPDLRRAFVYSDCWVEDARLVVLNALDAHERGTLVLTRTRCVAARRVGGLWEVVIEDAARSRRELRGRALVNATGPWAVRFLETATQMRPRQKVRLVKGSHIVVDRLYEGEHAYILQNRDRRIVFAIPYEGRFTLVGTTDESYTGDPAEVRISPEETGYLCDIISRSFARPIGPSDVVWSYSGVRPLSDDEESDPSAVTRDYVLELDGGAAEAPLLSVIGGKITIYRKLAEAALEKLRPWFPALKPAWTGGAPLPGGEIAGADFDGFLAELKRRFPWLPAALALRYGRAYGTRVERILGRGRSIDSLGREIGEGIHEAELEYLMDAEWARAAEDVLWRRSKLGLHVAPQTAARVAAWMSERALPQPSPSLAAP